MCGLRGCSSGQTHTSPGLHPPRGRSTQPSSPSTDNSPEAPQTRPHIRPSQEVPPSLLGRHCAQHARDGPGVDPRRLPVRGADHAGRSGRLPSPAPPPDPLLNLEMPSPGGTGRSRALPQDEQRTSCVVYMFTAFRAAQDLSEMPDLRPGQAQRNMTGLSRGRQSPPEQRKAAARGQAQEGLRRTDGGPQGGSFPWPVGSPRGGRRKAGPISEMPPLCFWARAPVSRAAVPGCLVTQGPSADLSAGSLVSPAGPASQGGDFVAVLRGPAIVPMKTRVQGTRTPKLCCPTTWYEDPHHRAGPWRGHHTASEGSGTSADTARVTRSALPAWCSLSKGDPGLPNHRTWSETDKGAGAGPQACWWEKRASQGAEGGSGRGRTPLVTHEWLQQELGPEK